MERLADILEKINNEKRVLELIRWMEDKDKSAARNLKRIISDGEIESIKAYKLKGETLNVLLSSGIVKYYNNDKAISVKNYRGGRQSRRIRKSKMKSRGTTRKTRL